MTPRVRLVLASTFFLAWIGYLAYLVAITRNPVILSRPQFLVADAYVVAQLEPAYAPEKLSRLFDGAAELFQNVGPVLEEMNQLQARRRQAMSAEERASEAEMKAIAAEEPRLQKKFRSELAKPLDEMKKRLDEVGVAKTEADEIVHHIAGYRGSEVFGDFERFVLDQLKTLVHPSESVTVVEVPWARAGIENLKDKTIEVKELSRCHEARGWSDPGTYILPLTRTTAGQWELTETPPSPGFVPERSEYRYRIYRATESARAQLKTLIAEYHGSTP